MSITLILGAVAVIAVIAWLAISAMFREVVPTNEVHIVQNGDSTISYGKDQSAGNVYYAWPSWLPKIGLTRIILPVSVFSVRLSGYEAFDNERLPFLVDIEGFFRIENSNQAAQRASSYNEMVDQLESILQGASRTILASSTIDQIMQGRSEFGDHFTKEVTEQLQQWGVVPVKTIELMDIRDTRESRVIANIMEKRKSFIEMESRTAVAENMKIAQIREVEANREAELAKQEAEQRVGIRTAEKEREVGIQKEIAKQAIERENKNTVELNMQVVQVQHVRNAEIKKEVAIKNAEAEREAQVIAAEAKLIETTRQADGALVTAKREAEAKKAVGEAEATAAKQAELALVEPQITLAKEIGENEGYQQYLINLRAEERMEKVGLAQAEALKQADLKVIANSSDVASGINKLSDILKPQGGADLGASLEMLAQTEAGKAMLKRFGVDLG